jgi:hypothetical protein
MEWLETKSEIAALQVVLKSAGVQGGDSVTLLRAKRNLEDASREERGWKEREAWVKCRALLELLTISPMAMLTYFDGYLLGDDPLPGIAHESLSVAALLMLYRHSSVLRNPTPPAILRNRLERALEIYPSNSIILGMFLQGEKGQGVWGRVRNILGESTKDGLSTDKDVARRVADVWMAGWERGRWEGEVERTRSGLAAAVQNERQVIHFIHRTKGDGSAGRGEVLFYGASTSNLRYTLANYNELRTCSFVPSGIVLLRRVRAQVTTGEFIANGLLQSFTF